MVSKKQLLALSKVKLSGRPCNANTNKLERNKLVMLDHWAGINNGEIAKKYSISECRVHQIIASLEWRMKTWYLR